MIPFVPLLADIETWLKVLVPLVMFIVYILNRLFGEENPAKKQAKNRMQPPPQPKVAPVEKQRVEDEVSDFLRRAAEQRQGQRAAQKASEPLAPATRPIRRPALDAESRRAPPPPRGEPVELEVVREQPRPHKQLAPSIDPTVSKRKLAELRHGDVEQADEMMQSHLHKVFDHQVGSISQPLPVETDAAAKAPEVVPTAILETQASHIAVLLRDPENIRQAIVVSEIMRRPVERW